MSSIIPREILGKQINNMIPALLQASDTSKHQWLRGWVKPKPPSKKVHVRVMVLADVVIALTQKDMRKVVRATQPLKFAGKTTDSG